MTPSIRMLSLIFVFLVGCVNEDLEAPTVESEIGWTVLSELDVESGAKPASLTQTLAHPIRIHGYAMPLEAGEAGVTSFLLVPDSSYCVHVPPPPPNQLILVEVERPLHWRSLESGLWLTGTIEVVEQESEFGRFMYKMKQLGSLERAEW